MLVREAVEVRGRDPGAKVLGDELERLGDDGAGAGHALDLGGGLSDDHRTATCSRARWISENTSLIDRSAWIPTRFPVVR